MSKFKNTEELEKAYQELERKFTKKSQKLALYEKTNYVTLLNNEIDSLVDDYAKRKISNLEAKLAESEKENKTLKDIRTLERVVPRNAQLNKLSNRDCYLKGFENAISETIRTFEETYGKEKCKLIEERDKYLMDIVKAGGYKYQIEELKQQLAESEKSKESYRLQNEHHHLQLLQFYSRLGVEAFGADIHEKALETLMIMKEELVEKKGLERALSACNRQNDEFANMIKKLAKENEILNVALDLACQTLYDINFKLYNTEMDFKEYFKQQALTHQHEDKGE